MAAAHGVPVKATTDKPYSIDDNLWGRAIECGVLEDPWCEPPADIWTMTCDPALRADEPTYVEIEFDQGVPCALDGKAMSFLDIIYAMNDIAGTNGYGRIDMVENRLVGVKSRECYEVPGGLALIQAHKALEDLCLERGVLHHKLAIEQTWAEQVYNGLWFSPLKEAFDAFLSHTQQCVSGTVKLKFFKGSCTVVGRKSTYSLYDFGLATYDAARCFRPPGPPRASSTFTACPARCGRKTGSPRRAHAFLRRREPREHCLRQDERRGGGSRGDSGRRRRRHGLGTLNERDNEGSGRS